MEIVIRYSILVERRVCVVTEEISLRRGLRRKKEMGDEGEGGRLEARGGGTVFFFRNRFRHSCRSLPGLNNEGAGGGRDIWRVLMFVSIFEIRRFIRVRWIVVRSVINIVGVRV